MIKQSIKNYFKCLKYVFTPLGVIALGLVVGLSIAIPGVIGAASKMCANIVEVSGEAIDFEVLFSNIVDSIRSLDWSDPATALSTMFTNEWFSDTVIANLNKFIADIESFFEQIKMAIETFISVVIYYIIVIAITVIIAFIAGFFLTKWLIRRDIAKRTLGKFLIGTALGALLSAACLTLGLWLQIEWSGAIYVTAAVGILLATFIPLFKAYTVYGRKKVAFKAVVNIKNILKLILSDLIIFAFGIVIVIAVVLLTNIAVGVFVGIGIVTVTIPVIEMIADAYVKQLADNAPQIAADATTEQTAPPDRSTEAAAAQDAPAEENT